MTGMLFELGMAFNLIHKFNAVHSGHVHITYHHVIASRANRIPAVHPINRRIHLITLAFQQFSFHLPKP